MRDSWVGMRDSRNRMRVRRVGIRVMRVRISVRRGRQRIRVRNLHQTRETANERLKYALHGRYKECETAIRVRHKRQKEQQRRGEQWTSITSEQKKKQLWEWKMKNRRRSKKTDQMEDGKDVKGGDKGIKRRCISIKNLGFSVALEGVFKVFLSANP